MDFKIATDEEFKEAYEEAEEFIETNGYYSSSQSVAVHAVTEYILFKKGLNAKRI